MRDVHITKQGDFWVAREGTTDVQMAPRKEDCIQETAAWAEAQGEPISVKIHLENGQIEEERTYPRSADPTASPG